MAYINNDSQAFYVTTEEVTYVRVSDNVETSWAKQAKITFKADNKTIASLPYTVENGIDGEIPEVPEKSGCKGAWEAYTLNGEDIVVNAVYTAHDFTEIETNISKMEFAEGFLAQPSTEPLVIMLQTEPNMTVEDMAGIGCPSLIMSGEKDLIRAEHTRLIGENIPGGRVKILPGEDHGSYICNSPKLAPLLLEFFKEIGY
jgi:hypothetical protein